MSSSDADSKIDMLDSAADVKKKIRKVSTGTSPGGHDNIILSCSGV